MSDFLPNGFDWADGKGNNVGTPNPDNSVQSFVPDGVEGTVLEESPDSPDMEFGEQGTIRHSFTTDWGTARDLLLPNYYRGKIVFDSDDTPTRILSVSCKRQKPNRASFAVTSEALLYPPPEEFGVDILEFNPAIQRHPRYAGLTSAVFNAIESIINAPLVQSQAAYQQVINALKPDGYDPDHPPVPNDTLFAAATELLNKRRLGEDTFYLAGFRVWWSSYDYKPIPIDPGGRIEDPAEETVDSFGNKVPAGGLPYYFWSDTGEPGGNNILSFLAATQTPLFYSNGISWLRQADHLEYQRTWFKITKSWVGGPAGGDTINDQSYNGHWDEDIYSQDFNGYNTSPTNGQL